MDTTLGLDISHHQDLALDLAATRRDGCEFVFLKAGEGGGMVDDEFAPNLAEARAAGQLVGAYWFIRSNASPAQHVALLRRTVPLDVPIVPDVEKAADGSWPTQAHAEACLAAIRAAGYRVPLAYVPLWFWRDYWRSPSLAGWPPLWSSRYPDMKVGSLASEWAAVPPSYWAGYGGLDVAVLQFTSSARIAGYQPLDANAFRGTRDQFAALLGQNGGSGSTPSTSPRKTGAEFMERITAPASKDTTSVRLLLSGSDTAAIIIRPKLDANGRALNVVFLGHIFAWGSDKAGVGHDPMTGRNEDNFLHLDTHHRHELPGAVWADLNYSSLDPFDIDIVG